MGAVLREAIIQSIRDARSLWAFKSIEKRVERGWSEENLDAADMMRIEAAYKDAEPMLALVRRQNRWNEKTYPMTYPIVRWLRLKFQR